MVTRLRRIVQRHLSERRDYARLSDWGIGIYNRILVHLPGWKLPGRGRLRRVRLRGGPVPISVRLGSSDWYVMEEIFLNGEYGRVETDLPRGVRNVVDLGANIGMSVMLWLKLFPGARVAAVEPDAQNVQMIRRNLDGMPGAAGVVVIRACAAGRHRTVTLSRSVAEWAFSMKEKGDKVLPATEEVHALTVPEILDEAGMSGEIDLLKCDIEGAEAEVFADCAGWIGRVRHLIVELHAPYTAERLMSDLKRNGAKLSVLQRQDKGDLQVLFMSAQPQDALGVAGQS
jgi:FkbM family methyltransferase